MCRASRVHSLEWHLFEDVVRPALLADLEQQAALDEVGHIASQRLCRDIRREVLQVAVGDAAVLAEVQQRGDLPFVEALASPLVGVDAASIAAVIADVAAQHHQEPGGGLAELGRRQARVGHLAEHAVDAVA